MRPTEHDQVSRYYVFQAREREAGAEKVTLDAELLGYCLSMANVEWARAACNAIAWLLSPTPGRAAYEGFRLAFGGRPLGVPWRSLTPLTRESWEAAARAARKVDR